MKRINFIGIILVCLLCTASRCNKDDCHKTIKFINNSSKDVYIYDCITCSDTLAFNEKFPNPYNQPNLWKVESEGKNTWGLSRRDCYESRVSQGRVIIYVFDAEVLANYSWGVIGRDYMVLKTIRPTLEEMERSDWTVTFTCE